jgi:outer membrane protein OmpA-like peptidoglycan-associated protein
MSVDASVDAQFINQSDIDGDATSWNIELGYAFKTASGWEIEPQLQYTRTSVDEFDAPLTAPFTTMVLEGGDTTRTRFGVAVRKSFVSGDWTWTPHATLSTVDESDSRMSFIANEQFTGYTDTDGRSTMLELGFDAAKDGWAIFGGVNWMEGGAYDSIGGQLGVRYNFGGAAPAPAPVPPPAKTCADLDDDGDGVNNCDDKCLGSTAGQAVGPDGCPVPLTIDLKGVNFDFDKATLRPDAVAILDEAVAILGKYPDLKVEVAGHTDAIGSEQYNQGLSERRAQTVYDYLGSKGVDAGRMVGPSGYGETRPIAPNTNEDGSDNPEGRAKNRRTELNVQN